MIYPQEMVEEPEEDGFSARAARREAARKRVGNGLILLALLVVLLFAGLGFALHVSWIIAAALLVVWVIGFWFLEVSTVGTGSNGGRPESRCGSRSGMGEAREDQVASARRRARDTTREGRGTQRCVRVVNPRLARDDASPLSSLSGANSTSRAWWRSSKLSRPQ